ncbi:hypothetical protein AMS68_001033 [Peltaster fructicola]|uniref:2'-phosphotransferase n=1 Tax=Peltaster fructicola TaxID=286661 RepID=A0A6H0XLD4_9PEZI|nr:hypothetical protein AMS68_001033 [Peltaster fructicola]
MAPRGSGRGGPIPREVQVSKTLSKLLRHNAEKEGLTLSADGYVNLASVLASRTLKSLKVSFEEVLQIVKDDDKQRYGLVLVDPATSATPMGTSDQHERTSLDPKDWLIRANQGHSIKLEPEGGLLTAIDKDNMPAMAVHGTTHAKWILIRDSGGLKPMGRNHVHFASGLPAGFKDRQKAAGDETVEAPVISGMRSSSTVLMYLDVARAIEAGLPLGTSANGVILSEGNAEGLVPLQLFKRVEDCTRHRVLLEDGAIVKDGAQGRPS